MADSCACIHVDTDDGPEAFKSVDPVAHKEHTCCECKRTILVGEKYRKESGIWQGRPNRYKTCSDCLSVRNEFFCNSYIYQGMWVNVVEYLQDVDGMVSTDCIMNLTPAARDIVFKILDEIYLNDE
jgi:hypothetical protein